MIAAFRGQLAAVDFLLIAGAKLDLQDGMGKTALMHGASAIKNSLEVVKMLAVENEANVFLADDNGNTAQDSAVRNDHKTVAKLLKNLEIQRAKEQNIDLDKPKKERQIIKDRIAAEDAEFRAEEAEDLERDSSTPDSSGKTEL